jgi:hypothetical protein
VIASGSTTLAAGARKTLTFKLGAAGQALLVKHGSLATTVTARSGATTLASATVRIKTAPKRNANKHR